MSKGSKILFAVFFLLMALSVATAYYFYVVKQDFYVLTQTDCDPQTESCFARNCGELWWFECTGDPESDVQIYKYIKLKASDIPYCDPVVSQEGFLATLTEAKECIMPECNEGDTNCSIVYCDSTTDVGCLKNENVEEVNEINEIK